MKIVTLHAIFFEKKFTFHFCLDKLVLPNRLSR